MQKRYIEISELPNFEVTIEGGQKLVLLPFEHLADIPTADVVEVKCSQWDENIVGFCNVCPECGVIIERTAIKNNSGKLNHCPNCGIKMKECS